MRRKNSVRFETYYKIQRLNPMSIAWEDRQLAYPSEAAAREAMPATGTWRVMEISEQGRRPIGATRPEPLSRR